MCPARLLLRSFPAQLPLFILAMFGGVLRIKRGTQGRVLEIGDGWLSVRTPSYVCPCALVLALVLTRLRT